MASERAKRRYLLHRRRRSHANGHGFSRWWLAGFLVFALGVIAVGIGAGVSYGVYQSYADGLVPPDEKIAELPLGGARILDRDGTFLYEFVDDTAGLRDPIPAEEISLWLILATIATEDASFLDNAGINVEGLGRAAWENLWPFGGTPGFLQGSGGSSITQQLVKNVYFEPEERVERSIERKIKETVYALELTNQYSKEQILEWYLNQISYGNVFVGVEAAAEGYFDKPASDLTLSEAATLAAIPSCPTCYDPISQPEAAVTQRNFVLRRMFREGYIDAAQLWNAAAVPLELELQQSSVRAPHFVFNVVRPELERLLGEEAINRDGLIVYTSIDMDLQFEAERILEEWITTFESSGGHNGAVVAIEPETAEILVYVGSRDYFNDEIDGQNDMAQALNSPGSAFKPITYLTTFMNLNWGPGTLILDTPLDPKFWDGTNTLTNPGTGFQGPITVRNALGNSLNIPAVKTILYAGVDNVIDQAKTMGITTLDRDLGPSLTVGGVDVKLIDMVYAFTAFPNLGTLKGVETTVSRPDGNRELDPISILRVEDRSGNIVYPIIDGQPAKSPRPLEVQVAPAADAFMISDILSDPNAQCITFGVCGALSIPSRPFAVKTGTSEPFVDSSAIGDTWAIGFTPQLVVGTWFGNADNSPMFDISSTNVSWRTVRDFAIFYHEDLAVESFSRPGSIIEASACVPSGLRTNSTCLKTTPIDLFPSRFLDLPTDSWWQGGRIVPPDGLSQFAQDQALEWLRILGAAQQQDDTAPAPAATPDGDEDPGVPPTPPPLSGVDAP